MLIGALISLGALIILLGILTLVPRLLKEPQTRGRGATFHAPITFWFAIWVGVVLEGIGIVLMVKDFT